MSGRSWTGRWGIVRRRQEAGLSAQGPIVVALDHFASRTESKFGIVVDRVWHREPQLSAQMRSLRVRAVAARRIDSTKRIKRHGRK